MSTTTMSTRIRSFIATSLLAISIVILTLSSIRDIPGEQRIELQ